MYSFLGTIILAMFKESDSRINMDTNKEVISRLKFIGRISKGEKINVRHAYPFVQQNDLTTSFSRTFYYKDNRANALSFVRNTIERSFEIVSNYKNSNRKSERVMCRRIVDDIKRAKEGIINLKETYITDTMFCCDMDTLLESIDAKLTELGAQSSPLLSPVMSPSETDPSSPNISEVKQNITSS